MALLLYQITALLPHNMSLRCSDSNRWPWSICRFSPPLVRHPGMVWPRVWFVIGSPSKNSRNKATLDKILAADRQPILPFTVLVLCLSFNDALLFFVHTKNIIDRRVQLCF